jgi:hypothetical protein
MLRTQMRGEANPGTPVQEGRGKRAAAQLPERYRDFVDSSLVDLDEEPRPLDTMGSAVPSSPPNPLSSRVAEEGRFGVIKTPVSMFGLYKQYQAPEECPYDPEKEAPAHHSNITGQDLGGDSENTSHQSPFYPFPNKNAFLLGEWRAGDGNGKGRADFAKLVEIITSPDWCSDDIRGINWAKIDTFLAIPIRRDDMDDDWVEEAAWRTSTVTINVPFNTRCATPGPHPYEVQFRHRPIVPMIREKLMNLKHEDGFHFLPYQLRWHPGEGKADVGVHGELYTSSAFLDAFRDLQVCIRSSSSVVIVIQIFQQSPMEEGCDLPRYIVALMFGSDETVLAQFGTAKLWPLYMSYGNDSKYKRAKLGLRLVEHLAYLSKVQYSVSHAPPVALLIAFLAS